MTNPLSPASASNGRLPSLPRPRHLERQPLPLVSWSSPLFRICGSQRDPLYFGRRGDFRFDDPRGSFGVLYAAATPEAAFVETCIRDRGATLRTLVKRDLERRRLVQILPARTLRLADLAGPGLSRLNLDGRLTSGNYRLAQAWSRACWRHPVRPDGLLYHSRFNPSQLCLALFDRLENALAWNDLGPLTRPSNAAFLGAMLDRYRFGLIE